MKYATIRNRCAMLEKTSNVETNASQRNATILPSTLSCALPGAAWQLRAVWLYGFVSFRTYRSGLAASKQPCAPLRLACGQRRPEDRRCGCMRTAGEAGSGRRNGPSVCYSYTTCALVASLSLQSARLLIYSAAAG